VKTLNCSIDSCSGNKLLPLPGDVLLFVQLLSFLLVFNKMVEAKKCHWTNIWTLKIRQQTWEKFTKGQRWISYQCSIGSLRI